MNDPEPIDRDPIDLDPGELEPIDPREAERMRRRDHEAGAESRSLMRPGMGKVFKQIQDSWAKSAKKPTKAHHPPIGRREPR